MTTPARIQHHTAHQAIPLREALLDLHDAVYAGSGDPLAPRAAFAPFLDHWTNASAFACTTAHDHDGRLVGYAYGAPLTAGTTWWDSVVPPLDPAEVAEDGVRTFAVSELLVDQKWRGTGTARALHLTLLTGRPERRSALLAHADHLKVVALYQGWGYHVVGDCVPFEGAPRLHAMLRDLHTTVHLHGVPLDGTAEAL